MKEIKRIVGLVLCFVMVFGLLPVRAIATETEAPVTQIEQNAAAIADDAQEGSVAPLAEGSLSGGTYYELDADGVDAGATYLIVSTSNDGDASAFRNNNGTKAGQTVKIASKRIETGFSSESTCTWTFTTSGNSWYIANGNQRIRLSEDDILDTTGQALTVSHQGNGTYQIHADVTTQNNWGEYTTTYYLRYRSSSWQRRNSEGNVYLFKRVEETGATVNFTVTPASAALKPGDTKDLTTEILVENEAFTGTPTIAWSSSDSDVATVSNGKVTAKAEGEATITATLSAVDGHALTAPINVQVTINVTNRTVVGTKLSGNDPVTTRLNMQPDFSNIKLTVTYDDGSTVEITTKNGLKIEGYDISKIGYDYATISYNGVEYGTVRVTVEGNPYEGLEEATDYPEYPADGAVRIDKTAKELDFASTGLVQVELDVAGVSVRGGVDAVLTIDISNSMAWAVGGTTDNFEHNKLTDVMEAVKTFAEVLLADNEDGTPTNNTISIVYFAGKDTEHWAGGSNSQVDAVLTACSKISDINIINDIADKTKFTGRDSSNEYLIQIAHVNDAGRVVTYSGQNRGDTNYDYAFWQTEQAVDQIIAANGANSTREIHVLLMTDGCATHFNNVYYNSGSVSNYYRPGTRTTYGSDGNFKNLGGVAWAQWIQESITENRGNIYARSLYEKVNGGYAVGFDMANGSFSGISNWGESTIKWDIVFNEIVQNTVQDKDGNGMIIVTNATDTEILNKFYHDLGHKLRYAGTEANVSDIIDPDFTLQMGNFTGTEGKGIGQVNIADKGYVPTITIKTYDLWTKNETTDATLIGTRKGTSQDIETVTFNDDGTEAYSDQVENGSKNILSVVDGVTTIEAHYFTYTKTPEGVETFKWEIGNITDKEIALSYYAYLKGSLEGEEPDGLKYTNEEATLEYIDINGDHATQIFPIPAVAWGGASTAYEFYLVNDDGMPCNRQGDVIPFANRIIITGPFYQDLYLNQSDEEIAQEIIAVKVLPAGYTLYDETAKYIVQTASGENEGSLNINTPGYGVIGKDENYTGQRYVKVTNEDGTVEYVESDNGTYKKLTVQTTIQVYPEIDSEDKSFIQSRVAFGVKYNMLPDDADFIMAPDMIVIDYGKSIEIDVNANNTNIPDTVKVDLIGFSKFYDNVDVTQKFEDTPYSTPFEGTYGTFSIGENGKVLYTPHHMLNAPGKIFCVYRITAKNNAEDIYYMVTELDVIPATIMYYETDFATGVFTYSDNWSDPVTDSTYSEENPDGPQNEGRIGQNTYGFDTTYDDDAYLSNGSSLFAKGAGVNKTTSTFSFTGTGFDLISRTGAEQGLIKVEVFADAKMTNNVKSVTVLNKSESNLELYQIPVVSINGLEHSTYYVKIGVEAEYKSTIPALEALNRGNEFYFDAIRIYDPAKGNEIAESAYNTDGEANATLTEVRQELITAATFEAIASGSNTPGMVYVDSTYTNDAANGTPGNVNVADYAKVGPNNEVYLSKNQAVAFKVKTNSNPASFDIGAKFITGGAAAGLNVTVTNGSRSKSWTVETEIASSTVQFIDLLSANNADAAMLRNDDTYVVITNTGDGVLSITDLKVGYTVGTVSLDEAFDPYALSVMSMNSYDPFAVSYTVDGSALEVARMVLTAPETPEEPEVPEEPEIPEEPEMPDVDTSIYDIMRAFVKVNGSKKNQKCTFTVVTRADVEQIEILQNSTVLKPTKITFKDDKYGIRTWTIDLTRNGFDGQGTFILTGIGDNGLRGESVEVINRKAH